ncbi:hypothetical protein B9N43_12815 [Denitratisoma sp. DHT3]|uniref:hypothetical protein n=1 Tax=Denitratisoma sp. DHT3 TaxID=1981880 RepID=UPI0011984421|nr:hypothetical protein [Denitratisoma sp. DHT3]QDX82974.1 hypothetical protein B9N43_12815 [Denitratisoma sp. DHT3]
MEYPAFFDAVPGIRLRDPLAAFLGAAEDGLVDYGYLDAVKLAGHSCPTVAAAYWMTVRALRALYPGQTPERGGVRVSFADPLDAGVVGVTAAVVTLLTGAAGAGGFKGLAGNFVRRDLLAFGAELPLEIRYTRVDGGGQVDVGADLRQVPADPDTFPLLQRCLAGQADTAEQMRFGELWQDRVRRILLEHGEDERVFVVR